MLIAAPGSGRYLVGEVVLVEPDHGAMLLHYWGCAQAKKARQAEPIFRRACIQRKPDPQTKEEERMMTVFVKDEKPPVPRNYGIYARW